MINQGPEVVSEFKPSVVYTPRRFFLAQNVSFSYGIYRVRKKKGNLMKIAITQELVGTVSWELSPLVEKHFNDVVEGWKKEGKSEEEISLLSQHYLQEGLELPLYAVARALTGAIEKNKTKTYFPWIRKIFFEVTRVVKDSLEIDESKIQFKW